MRSIVINQAITGMGGLGKTQLAVEFAWRYGSYFRGVHWLNLADPAQLDAEIARCGMQMALPNFPADQPTQVAVTLNKWKTDGPRLLVLDNFEAVDQVNHILPRLRHSNLRLLITSRRTDWTPASGLHAIPLNVFTPDESLAFLKNALNERNDHEADLATLADRLGYLPLALELASRYLKAHLRLSIAEYLEQAKRAFEHPSMHGWRKDRPAPTEHDLDLQRTFALSWESVKDETAQKLFQTAGYLAPNTAIPLEIFERSLGISSDVCDEVLDALYGLGLLHRSEEGQPTIHPLLAEYGRGLAKENLQILESLGMTLRTLSSEANNTGLPARFVPLQPHMPVTASLVQEASLDDADALWNNHGYHLRMVADYSGARAAFERALKIDEATLGTDHPKVAIRVNNLGSVLQALGDLPGARAAFERALKILEKQLGENHPNVATLVNNLGMVMKDLGDLPGARAAFERALKIDETSFGSDHPNVARDVNNMGLVMKDLGDLPGARAAFERALKIFEKQLGEAHPNVAVLVNNLGTVLQALGDLPGARAAFERALKIDEASFGFDHPQVAIRVNNLGSVLKDQSDLPGARAAFERALRIDEASFGLNHPNVARDVNNLGMVLQDLGDLPGARAALERALKIFEKQLGEDHPNVATLVNNLGLVMKALGDLPGARAAYERALKIDEATFGRDHPHVAIDVNNLGMVLQDLGDLPDARAAYERALAIFKKFMPPDHPNIKIVQGNLDSLE